MLGRHGTAGPPGVPRGGSARDPRTRVDGPPTEKHPWASASRSIDPLVRRFSGTRPCDWLVLLLHREISRLHVRLGREAKGVRFCYLPEGCTNNLIVVQDGSLLFQQGDSGGPFFIKGGNLTVGIRGIVVARYYDLFTTKNYVQGFSVIADYYRAVIVTS